MRVGRFGGVSFLRRTALRLGVVLLLTGCLVFSVDASSKRPPRSSDRSFGEFVASIWPLAAERGVSRETFDHAFAGVAFDPKVVANSNRQAEFIRPIWNYIAAAVSASRIERGRDKAKAGGAWLAKASQVYGVDAGVILGIWGLETDFGGFTGSDDVVRALANLAYVRFRGDYFRDELLSALVILEDGDIAPGAMRGSWAGATGQTQFMPSSYLVYAVDFEGHGRRDIWKSEADAIGSIANFLAANGWRADLPWGFEVQLPAGFILMDTDSSRPSPFAGFAARGVRRADGEPLPRAGDGRLLIPTGLEGPIFLITSNFAVIKAYNASTSYALAVGLLGDAIKGGGGLVSDWPKKDRPLDESQVSRLQAKLKKMGYDVGEIDGRVGDSLRSAVRAFQERNGLRPDGYADRALLKRVDAGK